MRVLILHDDIPPDARPDELDTLVQVEAVTAWLAESGHQVQRLAFPLNLELARQQITQLAPELVFNCVESVAGQGRLIHLAPALLDSLQVPYTGARTEAMFLTSSKVLTKRLLKVNGIATPPWLSGRDRPNVSASTHPWIIKSVWEDASLGLDDSSIVRVNGFDDLAALVAERRGRLGGSAFAEAFVDGREFNLSMLADGDDVRVLPPAEIEFVGYAPDKPRIVDYSAKWQEDSQEYVNTPRRFDFPPADEALLLELTRIAEQCWRVLGLTGYARVDFRVDHAGRPWVLEVNANPCLSPDAGFMAAGKRAGMSEAEVVSVLISSAQTC